MFDIAKLLVESVTKLIPVAAIMDRKRANKVAEIGLTFFNFYTAAIQVAEQGSALLESLSRAVGRHRYYYETGSSKLALQAAETLRHDLDRQLPLVTGLLETARQVRHFSDVATSGERDRVFERLLSLLNSKAVHITMMRTAVAGGRLDSPFLEYELEVARQKRLDMDFGAVELEILKSVLSKQTTIELPWSRTINELLFVYISSGYGDARLKGLMHAASDFKSAFQSSFKLEDVLLAQERRLRTKVEKDSKYQRVWLGK